MSFLRQRGGPYADIVFAYDQGIENYEFDLAYRQPLHEQKLLFLKQSGKETDLLSAYDEGIADDEFDLAYRQKLHEQKLSFLEE